MIRLIDADALKRRLIKRREEIASERRYGWEWEYNGLNCAILLTGCEAVENPIRPEPHWIPVTERLPENGRQVLVYARSVHYALAKYDEMREADGTYKKQWVTFDAWKPFYSIKEVIAWCELPEPYKG